MVSLPARRIGVTFHCKYVTCSIQLHFDTVNLSLTNNIAYQDLALEKMSSCFETSCITSVTMVSESLHINIV